MNAYLKEALDRNNSRIKAKGAFTPQVTDVRADFQDGAAVLFDVSFALGAFFAGMILAESPLSQQAAQESLPLRDAFAVLRDAQDQYLQATREAHQRLVALAHSSQPEPGALDGR